MSKIKAIFYDLDNTLYPQASDVEERIELDKTVRSAGGFGHTGK